MGEIPHVVSRARQAEMIDHERNRQRLESAQDGDARKDLNMPAERRDACCGVLDQGRVVSAAGLQVAAHPSALHDLEVISQGLRIDHRHPARPRSEPAQGVKQTGVIAAVDAWLHDHHALEAEPFLERDKFFD